MKKITLSFLLSCCVLLLPVHALPSAAADLNLSQYGIQIIAHDLRFPVYITHANDGSNRLFVVEKIGRIRVIENGNVLETPFLDISEDVGSGSLEQGFLGLVFHPDYIHNGWFYIYYSDRWGNVVLSRYTVSATDPNIADTATAKLILSISHPYSYHYGGQLQFGPDGYLYVSVGDNYEGTGGRDPAGNAQNPASLLGKILRLDVSSVDGYAVPPDNPYSFNPAFAPEVWAMGLRNPWRFSFDETTGNLYIADVGQDNYEEIDFQPAHSSGGQNYGWNNFEGRHSLYNVPKTPDLTFPVLEFTHENGNCAVIGGYVYRGQAMPELQGTYFFSDFCSGTIWTTQPSDADHWDYGAFMQLGAQITSFGEDDNGELYIVNYRGIVLKIVHT